MATYIRTSIDDGIGQITIDRPLRFNSLDVGTAQDLRKAGLALARDDNARVVVLRGIPGIFCSGADLKYIRAGGDADDLGYLTPEARPIPGGAGERFKQILEYLHSTIAEIRRAPKPFIAAVDGVAAAGGFGLAMCCDLVYASERAVFEWAYGKTGLTGAESSTFMLPRLLGFHRAMEIVLLNPRIDAHRAVELGLANAVFPTDRFDEEVMSVAARLAEGPPKAWGVAKGLIGQAAGMERLDAHLDREIDHLSRIADGAEFAEGLDSFFEKRAPQFVKGVMTMHEYALIQSLVARVEAEARLRDASAVYRLSVRIGEQSGVDIGLFRTAFMTFRDRTICEHAELDVETVAVQWACERCGEPIQPGRPLQCASCHSPARLVGGDEIILDRIEMEVA